MVGRAGLLNSYVGDFRLVDFLGAGGMGEVYRAVNTRTGLVAAVKVLTEATDAGLIERFFNEARIQASIQHPNIARFYEFHQLNNQPCIVMEYIHGQTLAERIRVLGRLPISETIYIFQSAVEAVGYIHNLGIVHRDIKSNNVKLSSTGQVKLLDFGIAKSETTSKMTRTGGVVGTLEYLSPEQLKGGLADARSDLWALGIMLYEMVTGQVPFQAETFGGLYEKIMKVAYIPAPVLNPLVPREVEAIIARCLKKKPTDRYQSAQHLLQDVSRLAATAVAPRAGIVKPKIDLSAIAKQNWRLLSSIAGGMVVVILLVLYFASPGPTPPVNPKPKPPAQNQSITPASNTPTKMLELELSEGTAQVWRDGNMIGTASAKVPFRFPAKVGEKVELVLKQEGYEDLVPGRFFVESYWPDVKTVGTFTMNRKK
jgi:serine/threonine-protein kinase